MDDGSFEIKKDYRKPKRLSRLIPRGALAGASWTVISTEQKQLGFGWVPLRRSIGVHLSVVLSLILLWAVASWSLVAAAFLAVPIILWIGRGYRGLECLVHGALHFDLWRRRPTLNDRLADLLMAFPVAQNVARSRPAHINEHHNGLGGPTDPCAIRMRGRADVANGELPEISETLRTVFTQAASYAATVKVSPIDIGRAVLWQVACVYAPVAAVAGFEDAAICYLTTIPAALGLVLPTIRALGEAGEHDYAAGDCDTVVGRTFDNIGFVNGLLHPFGDGWHVLHHLAPGVPQARLGVVMKRVIKMDPAFARYVRRRTGLLTTPRPYA